MRLLIVDDSEARVALIKSALERSHFAKYLETVYCDSADAARRELLTSCDVMLLDILIPKKQNGVPQAKNSISLLTDICDPKKVYIRPRLIIGLTADINELGIYQEQFAKEATVVLRGTLHEIDWIDSFIVQVESILGSQKKISQQEKDRILISVHGIRTYGQWQAKLSNEISKNSRSFKCIEIKYGYFDLLSFAIPIFRQKTVESVAKRVRSCIGTFSGKDIYIVAHSFGTLITSEALRGSQLKRSLKGVFFCGSPLRHDEDIGHITESAEIVINECGTRDLVLVLARLFVLGLGDAGRIGFQHENSDEFQNRYFSGGHSLYFEKFDANSAFYERFWVKLIALGERVERFDSRTNYFGQDIVDLTIKVIAFLKPAIYVFAIVFLIRTFII